MNDNTGQRLSLRAAYAFGVARGLEREIAEIRDMVVEWDSPYTSSLRRGYIIDLFEKRRLFEDFKREHWPFGNSGAGETARRRYLRYKADYEEFLAGRRLDPAGRELSVEPDDEDVLEFALESHLRDFLERNLSRIEPGLQLFSDADRRGVEFPVEAGRIDLLAKDKNGKFVVIELKLSRGRNKTLGQLLYYMGWVDKNLGNGPCRGYIIASEITDDLLIAVSRVPGVKLAKYRMSFAIESVSPS